MKQSKKADSENQVNNKHTADKERPMKTMYRHLTLAALLTLSGTALGSEAVKPGTYTVDASHTKVGFEVAHLVISSVEGRFGKVEGKVELSDKFDKSKFTMKAETASVDTGVAKRDEHLRSPDFFDAAKYPEMKFESTEVKGKPESFKLTGDLTIKGVTKKVTFDSKYLGTVNDGFGNDRSAFTAKAKINRKDFGLAWGNMMEKGPIVGDEVTIDLKVEATKKR
jgi:polyisoprenoid-binding protein YceI